MPWRQRVVARASLVRARVDGESDDDRVCDPRRVRAIEMRTMDAGRGCESREKVDSREWQSVTLVWTLAAPPPPPPRKETPRNRIRRLSVRLFTTIARSFRRVYRRALALNLRCVHTRKRTRAGYLWARTFRVRSAAPIRRAIALYRALIFLAGESDIYNSTIRTTPALLCKFRRRESRKEAANSCNSRRNA